MLDSTITLTDEKARDVYFTQLRDKYEEYAQLTPSVTEVVAQDGNITLSMLLEASNVVFYEIEEIK